MAADRAFSLLSSGLAQETDKSAAMAYFRGLYATTEAVRVLPKLFAQPSSGYIHVHTLRSRVSAVP